MKYFKLQSQAFGRDLVRRRNTTIHCFKLSRRVMLVWDFKDKEAS